MEKDTLLIVDDIVINREMLKFIFAEQFRILEAEDGNQAVAMLERCQERIVMMFLDLVMPEKSGLDVLEYMRENGYMETIPVIVITGEATADAEERAYEYGASDIIYKPFEPKVVMRRTMNLIELFQNRIYLEEKLKERTKELAQSKARLARSNDFLVNTLSSVVEFKGLESAEHILRIKYFTRVLLGYIMDQYPEYHLTKEDTDMIVSASALHDIGKFAVPDAILMKTTMLTPKEQEQLKRHTIYGGEMLKRFRQEDNEFYRYCSDICKYHHERYDGTGYPYRLKGDDIPIWAQVVALADCYDTLISKRIEQDVAAVQKVMNQILEEEMDAYSEKLLACFQMAKAEFFHATEMEFSFVDDKMM